MQIGLGIHKFPTMSRLELTPRISITQHCWRWTIFWLLFCCVSGSRCLLKEEAWQCDARSIRGLSRETWCRCCWMWRRKTVEGIAKAAMSVLRSECNIGAASYRWLRKRSSLHNRSYATGAGLNTVRLALKLLNWWLKTCVQLDNVQGRTWQQQYQRESIPYFSEHARVCVVLDRTHL